MKFYQNTFVLILLSSTLTLAAIGCRGNRSSSKAPSLTAGSLTRSGQSSESSAKDGNRRAEIDFHGDSGSATSGASNVALASYVSGEGNEPEWLDSYEEAVQLAKQTGRPILADFTGSNWCGFCVKLKKEVFDTPSFKSWAAENVVLLELDFPRPNLQADWIKKQNDQLRSRYEIVSYPTVMILNSDGSVIGKQGYMRGWPASWIAVASNTIQANQALQTTEVVHATDYQAR